MDFKCLPHEQYACHAGCKRGLETDGKMGRDGHAVADTDFVEDVRDVEEELEGDEEDDNEVPLEPFNLKQERQEGYFDEGGHYVENKKDNDEDKDAWLNSDEGAFPPS